ncbi:hypothetical protein [Streptomyces sp. NPDC093094]|uniref:hypothetical protein n=1 Tax=Streptomyces sp. NPDC093094 TaxID=3366026 RepID=UPI00381B32E8
MVLRARPGRDENEKQLVQRLARAREAPRDLVPRARRMGIDVGRSQVRRILSAE